ncbi:hypothetical protein tb265_43720 [Gemmatimonadetes bacterium T265]|nr:hypothetical protein tb265_43720 [Gemmatimonadetes bacterium T265]
MLVAKVGGHDPVHEALELGAVAEAARRDRGGGRRRLALGLRLAGARGVGLDGGGLERGGLRAGRRARGGQAGGGQQHGQAARGARESRQSTGHGKRRERGRADGADGVAQYVDNIVYKQRPPPPTRVRAPPAVGAALAPGAARARVDTADVRYTAMVPMRDGVRRNTEIFVPARAAAPYPAANASARPPSIR